MLSAEKKMFVLVLSKQILFIFCTFLVFLDKTNASGMRHNWLGAHGTYNFYAFRLKQNDFGSVQDKAMVNENNRWA